MKKPQAETPPGEGGLVARGVRRVRVPAHQRGLHLWPREELPAAVLSLILASPRRGPAAVLRQMLASPRNDHLQEGETQLLRRPPGDRPCTLSSWLSEMRGPRQNMRSGLQQFSCGRCALPRGFLPYYSRTLTFPPSLSFPALPRKP